MSVFRYKEKRWDSKKMLDSGGMPSSHSATVTALAVAVGLKDGTGGPAFAIAFVLACIVCTKISTFSLHFMFSCNVAVLVNICERFQVMYDASGVRLHAGRQAEVTL